VQHMTLIDSKTSGGDGLSPSRLLAVNEQVKQLFGIDLAEKVRGLGAKVDSPVASSLALESHIVEDTDEALPVPPPKK